MKPLESTKLNSLIFIPTPSQSITHLAAGTNGCYKNHSCGDLTSRRKVWGFIAALSAALILLTSLPYLYGRWTAPAGSTTLGLGIYNWVDNPVYYGYIEQVKQGAWLFEDLYTTEEQASFFNIFWLALGWLAKIFNLSPPAAFHLARIILIPFLVWSLYSLLGLFVGNRFKLKLATVFLIFVSGSGIILKDILYFLPFQYRFLWDVNVPEALIFRSAYASPHFVASWILLILSFFFFIRSFENSKKTDAIKAGLCGFLLAQFHPFYIVTLITIPTAFAAADFLKNKSFLILKNWFIFEVFLIPAVLYYLYLQGDIVFKIRSENMMPSPAPLTLLFSFGPLIILAAAGIFLAIKKNRAWVFIVVWFLAGLLLLYAPVPFQRRLIEGWIIPLGLLALLALNALLQNKKFKLSSLSLALYSLLFVLLLFTSNLVIWQMSFDLYKTKTPPIYLPQKELQAFDWLKNNAPRQSITLANNFIDANILPGVTGRRVFWGHEFETVNFRRKLRATEIFFTENDSAQQYNFLKSNFIDFIFWNNQYSSSGFEPSKKSFLKKVFANEAVNIYEID